MATVSGAMPKAKTATCDVCGKVVVKRCMLQHQRTNTCRSVGGVDLRTDCVESNVTADCEESTACQHFRCEEANATTISLVSALNTCTPGHYVQVSDLIPHQYYKVVKLEKVDSTILATLRHLGGFNVCYVYLPRHFDDILTNDIVSSYNSGAFNTRQDVISKRHVVRRCSDSQRLCLRRVYGVRAKPFFFLLPCVYYGLVRVLWLLDCGYTNSIPLPLPKYFSDMRSTSLVLLYFVISSSITFGEKHSVLVLVVFQDSHDGLSYSCGAALELHYAVRYVRTQVGEPCVAWCLQPVERSL
ncbi:hypothetical protein J6590_087812 [Homalodisca vitripennis]|nr:hypothetical protein J6590_087812 [Homalodisca vitripennis]